MLVDIIAGARPNFVKVAPIIEAIQAAKMRGHDISYRLIHTGQHYDANMSGQFFEELRIPKPHYNLEVGSGTQAEQTAKIMLRYEDILLREPCDLCIVVGDVNSTMACAITAKKVNNIQVAHVEAGLRSGDLTMPEEINRIVTDSISDYFFTTSKTASNHLISSGISEEKIFFVGNTMIDTLNKSLSKFKKPSVWTELELENRNYIILTLHRPSNVDDPIHLQALIDKIVEASNGMKIIFPVHPRTSKMLRSLKIDKKRLYLIDPLGYLEFNYLICNAKAVITDSGGITEETTVMGVPCMTLRNSTERPETCAIGTNELLGTDIENVSNSFEKLFSNNWKKGAIPELWDGKAAERIVTAILELNKSISK